MIRRIDEIVAEMGGTVAISLADYEKNYLKTYGDGTITIKLRDYEYLKSEIRRYEAMLDIPECIDTNGDEPQYKEYVINIHELIAKVINDKEFDADIISIKQMSDTEYHVKAEINY